MTAQQPELAYQDVHDLLLGTELTDIITYEVRGRRSESDGERNFSIEVLARIEEAVLEIRCKSSIQGGGRRVLG